MEDVLVPARSGQGESGAPQPSRMLTMELGGGVSVRVRLNVQSRPI